MIIDKEVGVPIESDEFRASVRESLDRMKGGDEFDAEGHVILARLWNTIETHGLAEEDKLYDEYRKKYQSDYLEKSVDRLEATLTKGMCFYSRKHDIYIGGKPHKNSQYRFK